MYIACILYYMYIICISYVYYIHIICTCISLAGHLAISETCFAPTRASLTDVCACRPCLVPSSIDHLISSHLRAETCEVKENSSWETIGKP